MAKEPQYYGFSLPTATKLQGIARRDGLQARHKMGIKYPPIGVQANGGYFAKVPVGGIPARSGSTPGEATCDIYKIEKNTGGDWEIQDAGFTVGVFNVFPIAVAFDAAFPYFNVHQDQFGKWLNEAPNPAAAANVAFFRLTAAKEMSGTSAAAVLVAFGGSSYADGAAILACDPYRITTGGAGDILGKFVAPSGAYGYGMKRATDSGGTPEYDIIDVEHYAREIRGRLTSPRMGLTDSGLIILDYIADGITPPLNGDGEILVHDDQELFPNALGEDLAMEGGAEVIATLNDRLGSAASPYYQVKMADQRCKNATARLGQTMCGETHFEVVIEGFESSDAAPFGQVPKPLPTRAYNPFRHRARNDGRRVALRWMKVTNPDSPDGGTVEGYCIIDVPKNKRKVAFDYRISADKTKLEAFRAECAVEYCEDPQWEKIADGESCGS